MKKILDSISVGEWRLVFWLTIVMLVLTGVPYLLGFLLAPAGNFYNGLHALSPGDIPVYYSYIYQSAHGNFLVKNLFTSEAQLGGTFNIWWWSVGLLSAGLHISAPLAFHLSRLLAVPFLMVVLYVFVSYFFAEPVKRKVSLIFLLFSSGVGFFVAGPLNQANLQYSSHYWWPIDLWLTEAITFNVFYQTSHFIASLALMLLIFLLMILALENKSLKHAIVASVLSLFYFNFHPYYLPVILGVLGLYWFYLSIQAKKLLWSQLGYLIILGLFSAVDFIYHFWLIGSEPVIGQRAVQNVTNISPFIFIFLGYGFLWFGLAFGTAYLIYKKQIENKHVFLLIWFFLNLFLIYSPFPFHSRYVQGLHVIMVIFTVVGLFAISNYLKKRWSEKKYDFWVKNPALLMMLFLLMFCTSNLYSVGRDVYYFIYHPGETKIDLYLPSDFLASTKYLSVQPAGQVVIAADIPSKFIPGFSGQAVFSAHAQETLFFYSKTALLLWFFGSNDNDSSKQKFLNQYNISYVFYSDYEKQLGNYQPEEKPYLKLVVDRPEAKLYQVLPQGQN